MPVTIEAIKSMSDEDLDRFIRSGMEEKATRTERRKQETMTRIRALAESVGVPVSFGVARGRPKSKSGKKLKQSAK